MINLIHPLLVRSLFYQLIILMTLIPFDSFARTPLRRHHEKNSDWRPVRRTVEGIPQPAQFGWEPHQECRRSGVDPSVNEFYNSVNHLNCAKARDVIRRTIYGNNSKFGKFYRCDGHDVPEIAIILTSDEDLDQLNTPDYSCGDHYALTPVVLRTLSGACSVGWDCDANAGGM